MLNKLRGKGIKRNIKLFFNLITREPVRFFKSSLYKRNSRKMSLQEQDTFIKEINSNTGDILEFLGKNMIKFKRGKFCITIVEEEEIKKFSPEIYNFYKPLCQNPFCLKIFLSQNFLQDNNATYVFENEQTSKGLENSLKQLSIKRHGTIKDTVSIANILSLYEVTPRVYDTFVLKLADQKYISQIMESYPTTNNIDEKAPGFINKLKEALKSENIFILGQDNPWTHKDFSPPDYNDNIGSRNGDFRYVDLQKFLFRNKLKNIKELIPEVRNRTHFGDEHKSLGGRYNYQSIPFLGEYGKRRIELRMEQMLNVYQKFGFDVKEKTILDVGCNMAGFGIQYLSAGAKWYLGLDKPELVEVGRKLLYYLNYSRFDLFGLNLNEDNPTNFIKQYGKIDLILFLSMQKHIGIPAWLNDLDYNYMFYEGHQNESYKIHDELIKKHLKLREVHYVGESYDGETKRPLFFLIK